MSAKDINEFSVSEKRTMEAALIYRQVSIHTNKTITEKNRHEDKHTHIDQFITYSHASKTAALGSILVRSADSQTLYIYIYKKRVSEIKMFRLKLKKH